MRRLREALLLAALLAPWANGARAAPLPAPPGPPDDTTACVAAIDAAQRPARAPPARTPPGLLNAIALAESGRVVGTRVVAWPWTIDVGGTGQFFASKAEAIAAVAALQAGGTQSIDVGCMQVNLMHHPKAFASLDEAFEPTTNVLYAQRFLSDLYRATSAWPDAVAAYHSMTPDLGAAYQQRVATLWPQGAQYGAVTKPAPARPDVDPYHVYTPEFRRELMADAALRALRDTHLKAPGHASATSRFAALDRTRR